MNPNEITELKNCLLWSQNLVGNRLCESTEWLLDCQMEKILLTWTGWLELCWFPTSPARGINPYLQTGSVVRTKICYFVTLSICASNSAL